MTSTIILCLNVVVVGVISAGRLCDSV